MAVLGTECLCKYNQVSVKSSAVLIRRIRHEETENTGRASHRRPRYINRQRNARDQSLPQKLERARKEKIG